MLKILVNGYRGKLGGAICTLLESDQYKNVAHICAGIDLYLDQHENKPYPTFSSINECDMPSDVIIDCSSANGVPSVITYAIDRKTPLLICTTGLADETIKKINDASEYIPVFRSANMSLGVNLLSSLVEKTVSVLNDAGFDIEIIEKHHNQKMDSPSGTALMLAESVNRAASGKYEYTYGRDREDYKKRTKNELGIHAIRGGTIIGEHSVIFAGNDEIVELKHSAYSKNVFAQGAIKAARFLAGKKPGLYTMDDLIKE